MERNGNLEGWEGQCKKVDIDIVKKGDLNMAKLYDEYGNETTPGIIGQSMNARGEGFYYECIAKDLLNGGAKMDQFGNMRIGGLRVENGRVVDIDTIYGKLEGNRFYYTDGGLLFYVE